MHAGNNMGIMTSLKNLLQKGGSSWRRPGAWRLSAALAGVSSAARGIQTRAAVQTRCSFQPYTQPCQPDLVQWASVSIEVCGTTPASRSFLCQTPPRARNTVLSMAAARAQSAQGWSRATKWRPRHPIWAGKVAGMAARRRSQVRRLGTRPWGSVSSARRSCISGVGSASTAKNSFTLCKRRTIMMTKAFRKSRSGYTGGRPRPRVGGPGMGTPSPSLTKVTSKDSCSNIGHLRTRWLGEPLCYGGTRARESSGAAQDL